MAENVFNTVIQNIGYAHRQWNMSARFVGQQKWSEPSTCLPVSILLSSGRLRLPPLLPRSCGVRFSTSHKGALQLKGCAEAGKCRSHSQNVLFSSNGNFVRSPSPADLDAEIMSTVYLPGCSHAHTDSTHMQETEKQPDVRQMHPSLMSTTCRRRHSGNPTSTYRLFKPFDKVVRPVPL